MSKTKLITAMCILLGQSACSQLSDSPNKSASDVSSRSGLSARVADANWVTVAPNGRYLMFEDGQSFVPVGVAMAGDIINFEYFGRTSIGGKTYNFEDNYFERMFIDMRAHGENFLRIDIEGTSLMPREDIERCIAQGKIQFLEDPVGVLNEEYARRIDRLVALAEKHDIYLSLVLITHTLDVTKLADNLDLYPYHKAKGGPITTMNDLMTDERAKTLWLARMRYISKRWGYSRRIVMWELFNELLNCGTKDSDAAAKWVAQMGKALRSYDLENYGKTRPILVSTVDFKPKHKFFYESPGTDIMVTHYYGDGGKTANPVLVALEIAQGVNANLKRIGYARPYMENERTLSMYSPKTIQKEMEHSAAWSMMASGALGPGCTWVRTGPWGAFRTKEVVSETHKAMTKILQGFDFATFDSRPVPVSSSNPEVVVTAVGDGSRVVGWVLHNNPDDYDIETISAWRSNEITNPKQIPYLVVTWLRLARQHLPAKAGEEMTTRFGRLLSSQLALKPEEGHRYAEEFLAQPGGFYSTLGEMASSRKGQKPDVDALKAGLLKIRAELESLEKKQNLLKKAYRAHPEVGTELTVKGLKPTEHRITWYDDRTGDIIRKETVSGARITVKTPPFSRHIAFIID